MQLGVPIRSNAWLSATRTLGGIISFQPLRSAPDYGFHSLRFGLRLRTAFPLNSALIIFIFYSLSNKDGNYETYRIFYCQAAICSITFTRVPAMPRLPREKERGSAEPIV